MATTAFPQRVLYATAARIGGSGLDAVALESLRGVAPAVRRVIAFEDRAGGFLRGKVRSLARHPVRLLSFMESEQYYGAKKRVAAAAAARELESGEYDFFHGWSGEALAALRAAQRRRVPSVLEIPTWHRHKGKNKPDRLTQSERERAEARGWNGWKNRLPISRQEMVEEYALATRLLVLSAKAEETFLAAGVPAEKLFRHQRGVDVERFTPAPATPGIFRAVFVGALICRKGVHDLLTVWHQLRLKDAELVLAGQVHPEMEPYLREFGGRSVKVTGFVSEIQTVYRSAAVHVFPSSCEGSAKATYEASACGLPQITTRESGDVVVHEETGLLVPPGDRDALAAALERLYRDRDLAFRLGTAGRDRVVAQFTWEHFRERLREAYAEAWGAAL